MIGFCNIIKHSNVNDALVSTGSSLVITNQKNWMIAIYLDHFQAIDKESDVQTNIEKSADDAIDATKEFVEPIQLL